MRLGTCDFCGARRNLRGSIVCDACAADWWSSENVVTAVDFDGKEVEEPCWLWEPEPDRHRPALTVALLAERRWKTPPDPSWTPSRLWDAATPSVAWS